MGLDQPWLGACRDRRAGLPLSPPNGEPRQPEARSRRASAELLRLSRTLSRRIVGALHRLPHGCRYRSSDDEGLAGQRLPATAALPPGARVARLHGLPHRSPAAQAHPQYRARLRPRASETRHQVALCHLPSRAGQRPAPWGRSTLRPMPQHPRLDARHLRSRPLLQLGATPRHNMFDLPRRRQLPSLQLLRLPRTPEGSDRGPTPRGRRPRYRKLRPVPSQRRRRGQGKRSRVRRRARERCGIDVTGSITEGVGGATSSDRRWSGAPSRHDPYQGPGRRYGEHLPTEPRLASRLGASPRRRPLT